MRIDKVKWITAPSCGTKNGIHSRLVQAEKAKFLNLTLPHKMCPRKQTAEPKLLILVSFFPREVTSYTDTSYCIRVLREVFRSVFMGHPV